MAAGIAFAAIGAALFRSTLIRLDKEHPDDGDDFRASDILDLEPTMLMYVVGMAVGPVLFVAGLSWLLLTLVL
jgi:hypothetical protein